MQSFRGMTSHEYIARLFGFLPKEDNGALSAEDMQRESAQIASNQESRLARFGERSSPGGVQVLGRPNLDGWIINI